MTDILNVPFVLSDAGQGLPEETLRPKQANEGDAGYDLTAVERVELVPHERALIDTGIQIAIPSGYAGFVLPRSGLALKKGLTVLNAPGLIDSGYRGPVKVLLWNSNGEGKVETVSAGDRIAQLVLVKVETLATFVKADILGYSERGDKGFGSSDAETQNDLVTRGEWDASQTYGTTGDAA